MIRLLKQFAFYAFLIGLWKLLFVLKIWPQYLLPAPEQVLHTLYEGLRDGGICRAIGVSIMRLGFGYGVSIVLGMILGVLISRWRTLSDTLGGLLIGFQALPSICWLPIASLWFGQKETAILFVIITGSLWSVALATDGGIKNIQPLFLRAGRNLGARGRGMFFHVILPAAFPSILNGLKLGWAFAWRALMASEILYTGVGLGQLLNQGRELNDMSQVMAVMLVIIFLGATIEALLFGNIERRVRRIWGLAS